MDILITPALVLVKKTSKGKVIGVLGFDIKDKGLLHYDHGVVEAADP